MSTKHLVALTPIKHDAELLAEGDSFEAAPGAAAALIAAGAARAAASLPAKSIVKGPHTKREAQHDSAADGDATA